jgi:pyruvyltransferase
MVLRKVKVAFLNCKYNAEARLYRDSLKVIHYQMRNWGDSINPIFSSFLTTKRIVSVDIDAFNRYPSSYHGVMYLGIGSIIHHARKNVVIWGSGLQEAFTLKERPLNICAVRGPMTRDVLLQQGLECPEIYGDPALLLPQFYKPSDNKKKYKLGIVSHIKDLRSPFFDKYKDDQGVKFISMRSHGLGLIDEIVQCEAIASTSLHGLVVADAYQIPALWIKVSNNIPGHDFKFYDYHASIGAGQAPALVVNGKQPISELVGRCQSRPLNVDLDALLSCCPYRDPGHV